MLLASNQQQGSCHPPPGYQTAPPGIFGPVQTMNPGLGICQPPLPMNSPAAVVSPLVEVALEITYVHLAVLSMMRPEFRMLPLSPSIDGEGRRIARLGRAHQPSWFEAVLLDPGDLSCISREACEFSWGGPDPAKVGLTLSVVGTGTVLVDDDVVGRGVTASLHPGSRVALAMQACPGAELCVIISLAVHSSVCNAGPGISVSAAPGAIPVVVVVPGATDRRSVSVPVEALPAKDRGAANTAVANEPSHLDPLPQFQDGTWQLECIFACGLAPEAFWALPTSIRHMSITLLPGSAPKLIGRQHQLEIFEALVGRDPTLLACISRTHFKLEATQDGSVRVTNMSQNIAVVSGKPLLQNDSTDVPTGDTLSFVHTVPSEQQTLGIDSAVSTVPFLTLRLVGPPPLPPVSAFEMLNSVPVVAMAPGSPKWQDAAAAPPPHSSELLYADIAEGQLAAAPAATAPMANSAGFAGAGREVTSPGEQMIGNCVIQASTAPVAKSGLLCSTESAHAKGGECSLM